MFSDVIYALGYLFLDILAASQTSVTDAAFFRIILCWPCKYGGKSTGLPHRTKVDSGILRLQMQGCDPVQPFERRDKDTA